VNRCDRTPGRIRARTTDRRAGGFTKFEIADLVAEDSGSELSEPAARVSARSSPGKATRRHGGRHPSIGLGRTHARTHVLALVQDLDIRIVDAATSELPRQLSLDPTKRYQATGRPPGPPRKQENL
jgi:hypothetical protein